jgi:hypothetical protein
MSRQVKPAQPTASLTGATEVSDDPTFCLCHDPVPVENCLTCLWSTLRKVTKARDELVGLARLLADGDHPPSAVDVRGRITELSTAGVP